MRLPWRSDRDQILPTDERFRSERRPRRLGRFTRMTEPRQRSIGPRIRLVPLAGVAVVALGIFALGPILWLGVAMIAIGFWMIMLAPVALLSYASQLRRAKRRPRESTKVALEESEVKLPLRALFWRGLSVACLTGALILAAHRGSTWGMVLCAVMLVPSLLIFALLLIVYAKER